MSEPCRGYFLLRRPLPRPAEWRVKCISCPWEKLTATKREARALGERHLASVAAPTRGRR